MNDQPITKKIKARLQRYTAMLRDIDNQLERLDRMEATMTAPPGPDLSGMPRGSGTPTDRTGMMVIRKIELEEKIKRTLKKERAENAAIEAMIEQLEKPDERAVIRLRYFDRAEWDGITSVLFGDRPDYVDRLESYQNRTYKMHGRALLELAAVLDAEEVKGTKRQEKE
jgi:hypothetical protein